MYLEITDEAQAKLLNYIEENSVVLLDMDDGVGEYSKVGFCSLDTSFRILILTKTQSRKDYDLELKSSLGSIYIKDYSKSYLDEKMTLDLDKRLQVLKLLGPSGLIDGHVEIIDLRPEEITK